MKFTSPSRVLAGIALILSGGSGFLTLAAWNLDQWQLVTFGTDSIPMAPLTAVLFVVLSLAQFLRLLSGGTPARERVILGLAMLASLAALAHLSRGLHGLPLPWDDHGFGIETAFGVFVVGRISPLTAACSLLAAFAAATQGVGLARSRPVCWAVSLAAFACLLIAGAVALAYAAGTPLGYQPRNVPMALLTALAFIALNGSLVLTTRGGELLATWKRASGGEADDVRTAGVFSTRARS